MIDRLRLRLGAVAFLATLLAGGIASAGPQEDAEAVSQGIESFLGLMSQQAQAVGLGHDKVTVTPDGDGFAVAITGLRLGAAPAGLDLGEIDYRLQPQDADTYRVSDLKLAREMPVIDLAGKRAAVLRFTVTDFAGLWSSRLQSFLDLTLKATDVSLSSDEPTPTVLRIADAVLTAKGMDAGNGRLDEDVVYTLHDVSADDASGPAFKAAGVTGRFAFRGFDFPGYRQLLAKLKSVTAKYTPAAGEVQPPALTEADSKTVAEAMQALPKLMSGYSFSLSTENASGGEQPDSFRIRNAEIGAAFDGIDTNAGTLKLHLKQDALAVEDPSFTTPAAKAVFPKDADINLTLSNVPIATTVQSLGNLLPGLIAPSAGQLAGFMLFSTALSTVAGAPLDLKIEPSTIDTEQGRLALDGDLRTAANGQPVGVLHATTTGLDAMIHTLDQAAGEEADAKAILDTLHALQGVAARTTGADGKPIEKFLIELSEDGQTLVNGKPLNGL